MDSYRHTAPKIRTKSSGSSGKRFGIASDGSAPQIMDASELSPRNKAIVMTKTAPAERLAIGRIRTTSVIAPSRNPSTIPSRTEIHSGTPQSWICHTRNVQNIAISPCAKFRCPVPRKTTTRPSARRV